MKKEKSESDYGLDLVLNQDVEHEALSTMVERRRLKNKEKSEAHAVRILFRRMRHLCVD
jgi:hypothetical protein